MTPSDKKKHFNIENLKNEKNNYYLKSTSTHRALQPSRFSGNTLYTSGQIALHPNRRIGFRKYSRQKPTQVMENMKAVLAAAEMTFENVIKTSIFISDMHHFGEINAVYGTYFNEETAPARETVEVANLPKFVNVEISMIAVK